MRLGHPVLAKGIVLHGQRKSHGRGIGNSGVEQAAPAGIEREGGRLKQKQSAETSGLPVADSMAGRSSVSLQQK